MNMVGLYYAMIGRLRQLSEPRLRQQAGKVKSQTPSCPMCENNEYVRKFHLVVMVSNLLLIVFFFLLFVSRISNQS